MFTVQAYSLDTGYPPVIHLFYDKQNQIQAGTIATSPNVPGVTSASSTGNINDLFPNQCVGFINPQLPRQKMLALLPTIYNKVARYKYVSLFQGPNDDDKYDKDVKYDENDALPLVLFLILPFSPTGYKTHSRDISNLSFWSG